MPIRKTKFAPDERYHICARGVGKQQIFLEERDYIRFLFLLLHFQSAIPFFNIGRRVNYFVKHQVFNMFQEDIDIDRFNKQRKVAIEMFAVMPNHIHIGLQELQEQGVSHYMQRLLNAYAKYFNTKYKRVGHVFEGPFRAVHIESNEQLLYLSAYIHRNPRELTEWKNREHEYPWSSYRDCISKNRWGSLLNSQIVLDQFSNKKAYRKFTEESGAKEKVKPVLDKDFFLDS